MLTNKYRPSTYDEIVGQELNTRLLKSIVRRPDSSPRSLVFYGPYGTGKTTLSRVFSKSLNCENKSADPCLTCDNCNIPIDSSPFYSEFDASIVGSVEKIRDLRDTFYYHVPNGWKVVTFDEAHLASNTALSALLKVIEEAPARVFFIFVTTEIDKIIPTIRSRSLELTFELAPFTEIKDNISLIAEMEEVDVEDRTLELIATRSRGHMRDAHMLLDQCFIMGESAFRDSVKSAKELYAKLFKVMLVREDELVFKTIDELLRFSLSDLKIDFEKFLLDLIKSFSGYPINGEEINELANSLGKNTVKIYKQCVSDWMMDSFKSDATFKAGFLALYQMLKPSPKKTTQKSSRKARAAKR